MSPFQGQDSTLRSFSTVHDRHNKNLGRASYNKKKSKRSGLKNDQYCMPPVTRLACGRLRFSKRIKLNGEMLKISNGNIEKISK